MYLRARPGSEQHDTKQVVTFIKKIYAGVSGTVDYNRQNIEVAFEGAYSSAPSKGGIEEASPFKVAASVATNLSGMKPLISSLPDNFPQTMREIPNHQNGYIGYMAGASILQGAAIRERRLARIVVSRHSFLDIVEAIAETTPSAGAKLLSVMFEQAVYKTNKGIEYPTG